MENDKQLIDEFKSELMSEFIRLCDGNDFKKITLLKIGDVIDRLYEKYSTLPTVDAAPVVRGRWKRRGRNLGDCSECGEVVMVRYPYCPNCGAKMDGGVKNE